MTAALVLMALAVIAIAIMTWIATAAADDAGAPGDAGTGPRGDAGVARDAGGGGGARVDAGAATVRDAGGRARIDAGAATVRDAGTPARVDAGAPTRRDAGAPARVDAGARDAGVTRDAGVGSPARDADLGAPARDADLGTPIRRDADFGAPLLRDAGAGGPALRDAEFGTSRLRDAGAGGPAFRDAAVRASARRDAGVRAPALRDAAALRDADFGAPLLRDAGLDVPARLDAGAGVRALLDAGATIRELLDAGVGIRALLDASATVRALVDAGAGIRELVDAGVGVPALVDAGVGVRALVDAGVDVPALVDAGVGLRALVDAGIGVRALMDAGAGIRALVDAGVGVRALVDAGVGVRELLDAGVSVPALLDAGVGVPALVDADVSASALAAAGIFDDVAGVGDPKAGAADEQPSVTAHTTSESTLFAIKVIGGLIVLLVLAYLGAHRRVVRFQEQLGISGVITAGFPFIALGVVAALPSVGILTGDVLENLRPLLLFGLGWLGFIIGAQLDIRVLERVPRGTAYLILVESILPFVLTAAACGGVMIAFGTSWRDLSMWRDVVLLGAAAAMTAPRRSRGVARQAWREGRSADVLLAQLDEFVGVIGLVFITAYFRVSGTAWQLPDTAWIFVSLGIGVVAGTLIFAMLRMPTSNAEFLAVVLGGIAFASGFAGYLRLSPIVVCFIAGVLVTNFPNDARENVFRILRHLERPVHLLFLIIAGAVWSVTDWRGWVLVPVFVMARVAGKWLGIIASRRVLDDKLANERTLITPVSVLSIALVISVENAYAGSGTWIVTAVIGGAIVSELLVQRTPVTDSAPDDRGGPVYIDELDEERRP